ncbi:MAG: energy transducer TonB [Planctomycetes bacterium]|nr:energy transducer TonB [Planctomycetota bacterium]
MKLIVKLLESFVRRVVGLVCASGLTVACFLVLPLMQAIGGGPDQDLELYSLDATNLPPPPPPPAEEEPEPEEPEEETPPELSEDIAPLDLSQLELALEPGLGDGLLGGDFVVKLNTLGGENGEGVDELFSLSDLDQRPRVVYQPSPVLTEKVRKRAPGTVHVLFIVDERGRVVNPKVQQSTDPVFDRPALDAVKQWKFEPGKRQGKAVRFRMRVPISFPKS